jgi:hypothetical protein
MFVGCALCVDLSVVLFSINSQDLFEVAAPDFIAGIAATHRVLAHPRVDLPCLRSSYIVSLKLWFVLIVYSQLHFILYYNSSAFSCGGVVLVLRFG